MFVLLVVELFPGGVISATAGVLLMLVSSVFSFALAREGKRLLYSVVICVFALSVYIFSKPNLHYGLRQLSLIHI